MVAAQQHPQPLAAGDHPAYPGRWMAEVVGEPAQAPQWVNGMPNLLGRF